MVSSYIGGSGNFEDLLIGKSKLLYGSYVSQLEAELGTMFHQKQEGKKEY